MLFRYTLTIVGHAYPGKGIIDGHADVEMWIMAVGISDRIGDQIIENYF